MWGQAAHTPLLLSVSLAAPPPSLCFSLHIFLHTPLPLLPSPSSILPNGSLSCSTPHSSPALARTPPLLLPPFASLAHRTPPLCFSLLLPLLALLSLLTTHSSLPSSLLHPSPLASLPPFLLLGSRSRPLPYTPSTSSPCSHDCISPIHT